MNARHFDTKRRYLQLPQYSLNTHHILIQRRHHRAYRVPPPPPPPPPLHHHPALAIVSRRALSISQFPCLILPGPLACPPLYCLSHSASTALSFAHDTAHSRRVHALPSPLVHRTHVLAPGISSRFAAYSRLPHLVLYTWLENAPRAPTPQSSWSLISVAKFDATTITATLGLEAFKLKFPISEPRSWDFLSGKTLSYLAFYLQPQPQFELAFNILLTCQLPSPVVSKTLS
ncbi:hypothetical protein ARSEF4850_000057 [Beauveria asiatica]